MMQSMPPGSFADQVHVLIATHQVANAQQFAKDFPTSIYQRTCPDDLEILNRYWRAQLTNVSSLDGSAAARHAHEALTYTTDFGAWLVNFQRYVLPLILRFDLPRS